MNLFQLGGGLELDRGGGQASKGGKEMALDLAVDLLKLLSNGPALALLDGARKRGSQELGYPIGWWQGGRQGVYRLPSWDE